MSLETTLADRFDGEPIGRGTVDVVCDCPHEIPRPVDCSRRVQYECIRVGESLTIFGDSPVVGQWGLDLLRCADCEVAELQEPTDGYEEALLRVDIRHDGDQYVLDTSTLTVIDHSPVDAGTDPPAVPVPLVQTMADQGDCGALRRSRLRQIIPQLRRQGGNEVADVIETELENSTSPDYD